MPGRVEVYVHSDSQTPNKGAAVSEVTCQTDFAAKTPEFAAFSKKVARMAYAVSGTVESKDWFLHVDWSDITKVFPEMQEEKDALEKEIKENVTVLTSTIRSLNRHWVPEEKD